jgi:hypothetical protein
MTIAYAVVRSGLVVGELHVTRGRARAAADRHNRGLRTPVYAVRAVCGVAL